jgi:hypothetical protein
MRHQLPFGPAGQMELETALAAIMAQVYWGFARGGGGLLGAGVALFAGANTQARAQFIPPDQALPRKLCIRIR